jgi:Enoyl-CoA hydratase/isomerase
MQSLAAAAAATAARRQFCLVSGGWYYCAVVANTGRCGSCDDAGLVSPRFCTGGSIPDNAPFVVREVFPFIESAEIVPSTCIAVLTLNNPQGYNTLGSHTMLALANHLEEINNGFPRSPVVIIKSASSKVFSAGHDLKEIHTAYSQEQEQQQAFLL